MGFETILPLREGNGPTLFLFPSGIRFCLAVQRAGALSRSTMVDYRHSVAAPSAPHGQTAASQDEVCEAHHRQTLLEQQPHGPYYLLGYSLGGTLAQGTAARLRQRGEQVAFLCLLDTWPPETQNWQEKEANGLDPEVLAEINREREALPGGTAGASTSTASCLPPLKATTLMLCAC
ncbi:thioesterase domain-containing protein [Klebsiella pneumoniae]|nr:thioesterase domain-containing protein [Klebsiella pneumoniae]